MESMQDRTFETTSDGTWDGSIIWEESIHLLLPFLWKIVHYTNEIGSTSTLEAAAIIESLYNMIIFACTINWMHDLVMQ